jgi:CRISPR-associated protein Csb2
VVGLAIRFELGRYHANPWGAHVNDAATEWPPSPWRLVRALYGIARTNVGLSKGRAAIDRALEALIGGSPPVFELPPCTPAHTRHYMPKASYSALRPGETEKVIDAFAAVDPNAELRAWWDVALDAEAADALSMAARSLGYLGRSESVCSARLITGAAPDHGSAAPVDALAEVSDDSDLIELLCPEPGASLDTIAVSVTELRKARRLAPPGTRRVTYAVPGAQRAPKTASVHKPARRPTLALIRLEGPQRPAIMDAVAVGQALRSALQHVFGRQNKGTTSPTFSGRAGEEARTDQHRHAHYLALPGPHGRRVERLVVWAPEGFGPREVEALGAVTYLSMHGIQERMPAALGALGRTDELDLPELLGPARSWQSLTPFGLVRHPKMRGGRVLDSPEDQVRRELAHRNLPEPVSIELIPGSWHRFRSSKAGTSRLDRASVFGVRLSFTAPLRGPVVLGAFSHFGLGVLVPRR